jgi:ACS family hexuronate transporter-like MFS transporter
MAASTILNYMDRQAMALVSPQVKAQFHLTNADFGWVLATFGLTYALFQLGAGYITDLWDVRKTYAGAVIWWSLAAIAAAFSPTLGILLLWRAMLGIGESFNWPCALRMTSRILRPEERSLGNGIFNSGAAVGAVLTPLIVPKLTDLYGWPTSFVVVGALGFVWVVAWLVLLRDPRHHGHFEGRSSAKAETANSEFGRSRGLSQQAVIAFSLVVALALVVAFVARWRGLDYVPALYWGISVLMAGPLVAALLLPQSSLEGRDWAESLGTIVRLRRFWVMVVVSVSINICWHFLVNWLPTYFKEDRNFKYVTAGMLTSIPFFAAGFGNLLGGASAHFFAKRGMTAYKSRILVMTICTLLVTSGTWVGWVQNDTLVVLLLGLMALGTAAFMANFFAFAQDVSAKHTGLIVGILGGLGNLLASGFLPVAGRVKDSTGSFGPFFVFVGLVPFLGLGALMFLWGSSPKTEPESA